MCCRQNILLHGLQYRNGFRVCKQLQVKKTKETATVGRTRRSVPVAGFHQLGKELVKLSPDMRNVVERYLDWRRHNGYGKLTRRWGK